MFWLVPAACVVTAIGAAVGLIALDQALGAVSPGLLFPGPPSGPAASCPRSRRP